MPRSTELEIIRKQLTEAKQLHAEAQLAHATREAADQTELEKAWQCGKRLNLLKENVGHGNWLGFLEANWPELSERVAQIYMKIDRDNPNANRVTDLKHDSIRKHRIANVPKKEHPKQDGDESFSKPTHYSTVINENARFWQRYDAGQVECDDDELRDAWREQYKRLQQLYGDA